ncbi:hypothetical protein Sme01_23350 [Sphaerisporangium melleum]|uniref:DUF6879 domain-containing protein n=1 Tax=Sphaerisporangium melleum TaxID=321316 RepID=A0A917RR91_9ACTN|nr:DUF6879 family protein [Sphaerisporangium melleum]GGL20931.1 hypothetical protein GCM10007964_73620 [Sphaerisporangium melleum]GII69859.1 hypothetical protein Sme01_23350 [Sphaerisporangium melleum]
MGRVFRSLDDAEFNRFFAEFRFTAYRLESLQRYDVSYEKAEFDLFLNGRRRGEFPGIAQWIERTVRPARHSGRLLHRVHVVEEPLSDYVRFECAWAYAHTVPAGEDVRLIPVPSGEWPEGLPRHDYWLFDSSILVAMHYREDGTFEAAEIVDDPGEIVQANYWRDMAVYRSISFAVFAAKCGSLSLCRRQIARRCSIRSSAMIRRSAKPSSRLPSGCSLRCRVNSCCAYRKKVVARVGGKRKGGSSGAGRAQSC